MDNEHDDDPRAAEKAVAAFFHISRSERKKAQRDKPKGDFLHHRANTDWWNHGKGKY
ncbi:hypothetical protein [Sphingobium sp. CFD-2]|uniref:hypothetical protein n=1 Tax=Sphingobium sp. CFD-2 TaxID=2878542 RepID=UPI00214C4719|nr:hypothetical protein [Sphingobium sp. CFD-2]